MPVEFGNPAESLVGLTLTNGWQVNEIIKKKPGETGGHFSVCYIVEKNNQKAFLKALDLTSALHEPDFIGSINSLSTAFLFERDLLFKCKNHHLSKIVTPLENGQYLFEGQPAFMSVYYIIFEMADTNLRSHIAKMANFDLAWILRSLHHTAVGLEQLHKSGIAHQDLKPSNVLIFNDTSKLSDLGRSSDKLVPSQNDRYTIPGDSTYAPFDLFYPGNIDTSDFNRRLASDLYHLGSLVFFYFLHLNLQQILWSEMVKHDLVKNLTKTDFVADLPYFQQGFSYALEILNVEIKKYSENACNELMPLVRMLCEPDPRLRGHTTNIQEGNSQYSLERFITGFNLIAKKAELRII
jgi:eukaryotic-like serine/threonine-protein kinase